MKLGPKELALRAMRETNAERRGKRRKTRAKVKTKA